MGNKIVYQGGEGEIVEKKSRFIATVRAVHSEDEANAFIAEMKKKYWNARHNCSAFIVGERGEIQRCSDDGEPQGTAGKPMLEVLLGAQLTDAAVVVTRYFGGVLLGTGGLVRAYSKAVQEGLSNAVIIEKMTGSRLTIKTDYNGAGKIQYLLGQRGLQPQNIDYTESVTLTVLVEADQTEELKKAITEATNGRAECLEEKGITFASADGQMILL